jgi:hypothetical protein
MHPCVAEHFRTPSLLRRPLPCSIPCFLARHRLWRPSFLRQPSSSPAMVLALTAAEVEPHLQPYATTPLHPFLSSYWRWEESITSGAPFDGARSRGGQRLGSGSVVACSSWWRRQGRVRERPYWRRVLGGGGMWSAAARWRGQPAFARGGRRGGPWPPSASPLHADWSTTGRALPTMSISWSSTDVDKWAQLKQGQRGWVTWRHVCESHLKTHRGV